MTARTTGTPLPPLLCLCGLLASAGCPSGTAEDTAAADAVIQQFADFFQEAPAFQVQSRIEVVIADTAGHSHNDLGPPPEDHSFVVQRPGQLAFQSGDGIGIVSDGTSVAAWSAEGKKFWRSEVSTPLADLMTSPVGSFFGNPWSVRPLLWAGNDPAAALTLGFGKPGYVGRDSLDGRPAHHLRIPGNADQGSELMKTPVLDVWIAAEGDPVPLQTILKQPPREVAVPGGPQFTATVSMVETFRDWKFETPASEQFEFHRPEGARRVADVSDVLAADHPLVGNPAPELGLPLVDGETLRLADHAGKDVVILDFWATWCKPCLLELPLIAQIASDYRDRAVVLYAVNQRETQIDVKLFLAAANLSLAVPLDTTGTASTAYDARSLPYLVLIGRDGTVQAIHTGIGPGLEETVRQELDALVEGVDLATDGLPDTPSP